MNATRRLRRQLATWIATASLFALASGAIAAPPAAPDFVADPAVALAARQSAAEAVAVANEPFHIKLDFSEASMDDVEHILDMQHLSFALASHLQSDSQMMHVAEIFGAYMGEVYRRNRGAAWGHVTLNGNTYPGFRTDSGIDVWATGRALNRISDGPDNNVAEFYRKLVRGPSQD